jgi:hypothetical protein
MGCKMNSLSTKEFEECICVSAYRSACPSAREKLPAMADGWPTQVRFVADPEMQQA